MKARRLTRISRISVIGALLAASVPACNFYEEKTPAGSEGAALLGRVSYAMVREKVFGPSCVGCHGTDGGVNLESYAGAFTNATRIRNSVFMSRKMPKNGALSPEQRAMLQAWLDSGAPENAGSAGTPVEKAPTIQLAELSYANVSARIFQAQCVKCHGNGVGVDLKSYETVKANLSKVAIAALAESSMPPRKPLSLADRTLLSAWINAGAPEKAPFTGEALAPTYDSIRKNVFEPLCLNCHGSGKLATKVPLTPYSAIVNSSTHDTVIPGKSDSSALIEAISKDDDDRMPPPETHLGALPPETVEVIRQWIDLGAPEK